MKTSTKALLLGAAAAVTTAIAAPLYYQENRVPEATEYTFRSRKVTQGLEGYRLVVVADLHGESYGKDNVRLLHLISTQQPDIIVLPGDLTDSYFDRTETALKFIREAVKLAPCWYVTGNHEHRMTQPELVAFLQALERLGVHVLRNEAIQLGVGEDGFRLIGMDCNQAKGPALCKLMENRPADELNILLSHKPHFAENYERAGVDLAICGHAHGGQFRFPGVGGLYAPGQGVLPQYTAGMYRLGKTVMAVSRGAGNSSFPVRIGNRPEIVTIVLRGTHKDT